MKRFGEKLRTLRTYHQLTLLELAHIMGYSTHAYISEIENGIKTPTANFILNISLLFGCTTDELMKDDLDISIDLTHKPGEENGNTFFG